MAGIRQLRQIQLGRETTAATTRWRGLGAFEDRTEVVMPEEFIGIIGGGDRSYISKYDAGATFDDTDLTFEQLPHLLIAGIANTTTGTQDGTGSGYVYTYNIAHSTAPTVGTYTLRAGDNQQAEIMDSSFVQSFSIKGNAGEPWMMSANWVGKQITTSVFSTSVSIPTVETALFSRSTFWLNSVSDTYGWEAGTPWQPLVLSMEINFDNLMMPKFVMGNSRAFNFIYPGNREISGSITFEHDALGVAEKEAWRNEEPRLMRVYMIGSSLTTNAAAPVHTNKTVYLDLPIKYTSFDPLDDQDGNSIVKASFVSRYNATAGDAGKFIIVLDGTTSIP